MAERGGIAVVHKASSEVEQEQLRLKKPPIVDKKQQGYRKSNYTVG